MKNPLKIMTRLAVLCAAASMTAQAEVFDFTDGTYLDGSNLGSNPGWTGGGNFYVVTNGVGVVVPDTAGNNSVRRISPFSTAEMTIGAVLRFSESGGAPTTDRRSVLEIGLTGSENLNFNLTRRNGTDSEYQVTFPLGSDVGGSANSARFAGSLLGLNLAGGDVESDRLFLTFTIKRGLLPNMNWTGSARLFNLATDPDMLNAIISFNNLVVNPADALWGEALNPYMNNAVSKESGNMTGLTVESFTATAVPDPVPGPDIDENFTAAEGYMDGALGNNAGWTTSEPGIWQVDATAGTVTSTSNDASASATFSTAAPSTVKQIFTMDFSFIAGTFQPGTGRALVRLTAQNSKNISFNNGVNASFNQSTGANVFNIGIFENPNGGSGPPSGPNFSGATIGLVTNGTNDGFSDNVSDRLRYTLTNTYTGAGNLWNTTAELYNLDTGMIVKSLTHSNWLADNDYLNFNKLLRFDNQQLGLLGDAGATSVTISRVASNPEPPAAGFAGWIDGFDLLPADQDPTDDPDNDGLNNLLEFVLNGNPSVSDPSILPDLLVTTDDFEFTYQRRDDSVSPETTQTSEWGTTLATWPGSAVIPVASGAVGAATITVSPGVPDDGITDTVKISIPKTEAGGAGKLFGRLQVTTP